MTQRRVDYDEHGTRYTRGRRTDPRIEARVHAALGEAETVLNVGAGTGSYEPRDRWVLAVEPSATMRAQRPAGAAPAIDARAEALPLDDGSVDAAMACVTIHHWQARAAGLAETRIVGRLARDLESGLWDERHGQLRELDSFEGSLRLVVSEPPG